MKDLREEYWEKEDMLSNCIPTMMGQQAMDEFGFQGYFECNAKTGEDITELFNEVMKIHFTRFGIKTNEKQLIVYPQLIKPE